MAKIITKKDFSNKDNLTKNSSTVFERTITTEVKGIKAILANNENSINEIKKSLKDLSKTSLFKNNLNKDNLYGATEINEENKKKSSLLEINNSIKELHKGFAEIFGTKKETKKEDNLITKLFKKVFSLGNLFKAALAALPFIFKDTLKELIGKGLSTLGLDKEKAFKIADYLVPAIQGAGIGYLLFRNVRGIISGAVVGVGYTFIQQMVNKFKNNAETSDEVRQIEGLGNLTKGVIIGAGLGFGFSGIKGMIAGAVIGAVASSITNLVTQWKDNIENPRQKTTAEHFSNLAEGAFYGAISGAIIGSKFGGLKGMFVGLAAGAIIGGASGIISSMISSWKAKNTQAEQYMVNSPVYKQSMAGTLNSTYSDIERYNNEIKKAEKELSEAKSNEEKIELQNKINKLKTDRVIVQNNLENKNALSFAKEFGVSGRDWYRIDGKLVDLNAKQNFWRKLATDTVATLGFRNLNDDEQALLEKQWVDKGLISKDIIDSPFKIFNPKWRELRNEVLEEKKRKYKASRMLGALVPGSNVTYGSEGFQELNKKQYELDSNIKSSYPHPNMSLINDKNNQDMIDTFNKDRNSVINYSNRELELLERIAKVLESNNNPYPYSPVTNSTSFLNGLQQMSRF